MKTRRIGSVALVLLLLLLVPALAQQAFDDLREHPVCPRCGMDREKASATRMLVRYGEGGAVGTCSIRCTALELRGNPGKDVRAVLVADANSRELIDATKADWVIQWGKPGTMTKAAKWAFRSSEALERFVAANGGARTDYEGALRAAQGEP